MAQIDLKEELAAQATEIKVPEEKPKKLTKSMSIADLIKAMEPEIKRALPSVITPERFTRIALSALNNTPQLQQCTPMSFLAALLNAAQLGLEVNSPLGQAYLIPYKNKGILECQFQLGYKGLMDLAFRSGQVKTIMAQEVYEKDEFQYEYGLNAKLVHRPAFSDRGELTYFYAYFQTVSGGYGFAVMSRTDMDQFAQTYSKAFASSYSPWKTAYAEMGKKTVLKQSLKYAPLHSEFQRALSSDESVKSVIAEEMYTVDNELFANEVAA